MPLQLLIYSHEDLALHADLILIGTVKSQWFDFRPFDDMPLIDTVKVQPEEWLKNNHGIDSEVEIRYYGKWAKIADELRARGMGSAAFQPEFKIGEKVLLFLAKEKPGMYMGEGYYSFGYQGKYSINGKDIAQNLDPEKTISMDEIRKIISEQLIQIQKDINSDDILISRTTSDITDMFLEKHPDAEVFVNRDGDDDLSVNYKTYFTNKHEPANADNLPFLLLKIQFDKSGLRDDQYPGMLGWQQIKHAEKTRPHT